MHVSRRRPPPPQRAEGDGSLEADLQAILEEDAQVRGLQELLAELAEDGGDPGYLRLLGRRAGRFAQGSQVTHALRVRGAGAYTGAAEQIR
jgi:hypothetical protein